MGLARGRGGNLRGKGNVRGRGAKFNGMANFRGRGIGKPPPLMGPPPQIGPPPPLHHHAMRPLAPPPPALVPRMRPGPPLPLPRPHHPGMRGPMPPPLPPPEVYLGPGPRRFPPPFPPQPRPLPPPSFPHPVPPRQAPPGIRPGPIMRPIAPPMMRSSGKPFGRSLGVRGGMATRRGGMVVKRGGVPARRGGKGKKKSQSSDEAELNKPWVTDAIKSEIQKKQNLLQKAKQSSADADWSEFKEQKNKVSTMLQAAKLEYIGNHPEEIDDDELYCENCDRGFLSAKMYMNHVDEHEVCGIDGCQYVAHPKIIDRHVKYQHDTGLFEKIQSADTPDKISKWIEERKLNYPTKDNIKRRQAEKEERIKRGERLDHKETNRLHMKGGHTLHSGRQNKIGQNYKFFDKRRIIRKYRKVTQVTKRKRKWLHEDELEGESRKGVKPFPGTAYFYEKKLLQDDEQNFSDEEWERDPAAAAVRSNNSEPAVCNALKNLMSSYASETSESEDDEDKCQQNPSIVTHSALQDMSCAANVGTTCNGTAVKESSTVTKTEIEASGSEPEELPVTTCHENMQPSQNPVSVPCVTGASNETKKVRKRKRVHRNKNKKREPAQGEITKNGSKESNSTKHMIPHTQLLDRTARFLENLLRDEIIHERNVILQCIRYVVSNNFFEIESKDVKNNDIEKVVKSPVSKSAENRSHGLDNIKINVMKQCIRYIVESNFFHKVDND